MKKIAVLVGLLAALVAPAHADINAVSSATLTADTYKQIIGGKVWLYKIVVSSPGTGTTSVSVFNSSGGAVVGASTMTILDASAVRNFEFGCYISSGLVYTTAGTQAPGVSILYSRRIPTTNALPSSSQIEEVRPYSCYNSTGIYTTRAIRAGRTFLKKVIVTKADTAGTLLTIYDSSATATTKIGDINTATVNEYKYNVMLSSGLTYSTAGSPNVTFVYDMY